MSNMQMDSRNIFKLPTDVWCFLFAVKPVTAGLHCKSHESKLTTPAVLCEGANKAFTATLQACRG